MFFSSNPSACLSNSPAKITAVVVPSPATVLAQSIVREGMKSVSAGINPMDLKRGIDKAVLAAVEALKESAEYLNQFSRMITFQSHRFFSANH